MRNFRELNLDFALIIGAVLVMLVIEYLEAMRYYCGNREAGELFAEI